MSGTTTAWVIWCAPSTISRNCRCCSSITQQGAILWGVCWGCGPLQCAPVFSPEPLMHGWAPHHSWCNYLLVSFVSVYLLRAGLWSSKRECFNYLAVRDYSFSDARIKAFMVVKI
jgi:hypothetical protein